jgi:ABC-2 type transport system permease protein
MPSLALVTSVVTPSRWRLDFATIRVLAGRDLKRFFRQRSRVVGAFLQPVVFWFVLGSGFAGSFRAQGAGDLRYAQFFFPGVVTMVLLFSTIFATISVIEDRREGFLQCVLAGPGSRLAVVIGKSLGSTLIALVQAALFMFLAPLAKIDLGAVNWPLLAAVMLLAAMALTGVGFAMAWWINSSTGYHAVMSVVLIPAWVLSGAMFPISGAGRLVSTLMKVNPMRFAVEGVRRALYGNSALAALGVPSGTAARELIALSIFAAIALGIAAWRVQRRE